VVIDQFLVFFCLDYEIIKYCSLLIQAKKRCRKTPDFWREVGEVVGHSGEQTERLFKNLSTEFQKLKQASHVSGAATDTPALRGSERLFLTFEQFYALVFPHGGSTLPSVILTERSLTYTM